MSVLRAYTEAGIRMTGKNAKCACNDKLTNGVTLPAATALAKAGAVHHVSLVVPLGEGLVNLVCQTIHTTLV